MINYKVLESLKINNNDYIIANEGLFNKIMKKISGPKLPEEMSEISALHKYIDDKKLYNKSESETINNVYGTQIYERISNEYKNDPDAALAGMKIIIHSYTSQNTKFPTWIVINIMNNKPEDFYIAYANKNKIVFKWRDVVVNANK